MYTRIPGTAQKSNVNAIVIRKSSLSGGRCVTSRRMWTDPDDT